MSYTHFKMCTYSSLHHAENGENCLTIEKRQIHQEFGKVFNSFYIFNCIKRYELTYVDTEVSSCTGNIYDFGRSNDFKLCAGKKCLKFIKIKHLPSYEAAQIKHPIHETHGTNIHSKKTFQRVKFYETRIIRKSGRTRETRSSSVRF